MQSNFNIDTSSLDADAFTAAGETIEDRLEEADLAQMQQEDPEAFAQETGGPDAEVQEKKPPQGNDRELDDNDPRKDGVGFNLPDIIAEAGAAIGGGRDDTASSALTFPERVGDMVSGEANEQDYDGPDWDPLVTALTPSLRLGGVAQLEVHYSHITCWWYCWCSCCIAIRSSYCWSWWDAWSWYCYWWYCWCCTWWCN